MRTGSVIENTSLTLPFIPPLLKLINLSVRGCNKWAKLLMRPGSTNEGLQKRERIWEQWLGSLQGISFWDKCYKTTKSIFFDNKLKWFQFQITRGT